MTDIDFDELDKAVSSLMDGETPKQQNESSPVFESDANASVADTATSSSSPDIAEETNEPTVIASAAAATVTRPAGLAVKRRGQFMDVMHPSADMKNTRANASVSRISRSGVTLTPSSNVVTSESGDTTASLDEDSLSTDKLTTLDGPTMIAPEPPTWPDPLAFDAFAKTDTDAESTDPASGTTESTPSEVSPEPLSSPFLPDAKVEKRPLGEALPTGTAETTESTNVDQADLPDELSGNILAVELNDLHADIDAESEVPAASSKTPEDEPVSSAPSEPAKQDDPETSEVQPAVEPTTTSITPQYKTQDQDTEPAEHSALYDEVSETAAAKTVKKKSGWFVPVAIVLLILLGGGAGVAAYYLLLS